MLFHETTSSLKVKREQESTNVRAHKMMKGKVKPYVVPTIIQATKKTVEVPQMTSP
jgi:hypothetical protein